MRGSRRAGEPETLLDHVLVVVALSVVGVAVAGDDGCRHIEVEAGRAPGGCRRAHRHGRLVGFVGGIRGHPR